MTNRFGWRVGGVSLHQQKPIAHYHFDILQQLKFAKVHSKTSLREVLSLHGGRGVLIIAGIGR